MKIDKVVCLYLGAFLFLSLSVAAYSQDGEGIVLDDFEGVISGGESGTVDFGSGGGSNVEVNASKEIKYHGEQSLEIKFDAVAGGYMWVGRGYDLDVQGAAAWLIEPKDIDFSKVNAISFYMHGTNTGAQVAIDLVDSGYEYWRYLLEDNFSGWKEFVLPFSDFLARGDWQPDKADKNAELNFPIKVFQVEPRPISKGVIYVDYVRLVDRS